MKIKPRKVSRRHTKPKEETPESKITRRADVEKTRQKVTQTSLRVLTEKGDPDALVLRQEKDVGSHVRVEIVETPMGLIHEAW